MALQKITKGVGQGVLTAVAISAKEEEMKKRAVKVLWQHLFWQPEEIAMALSKPVAWVMAVEREQEPEAWSKE